jgi:anoctamin-10
MKTSLDFDLISRWKAVARRMLFIPFGVASALALMLALTLIFAFEVYLSEVHDGPFKKYLVFCSGLLDL